MIKDIANKSSELGELLNQLSGEIPEGYRIHIEIGRETGCVELFDADYDLVEFETNYECFGEEIYDAYRHAVNTSDAWSPADGSDIGKECRVKDSESGDWQYGYTILRCNENLPQKLEVINDDGTQLIYRFCEVWRDV